MCTINCLNVFETPFTFIRIYLLLLIINDLTDSQKVLVQKINFNHLL